MKPYEKLLAHWGDAAVAAQLGATESEVVALEQRYSVKLPQDFRDYLIHACPREEDWSFSLNDDLTEWWHVERVTSVPDDYYNHRTKEPAIKQSVEKYLFFADYLVWCWAWAINCSDDEHRGRIAVFGDKERFVADSFAEFVDLFIDDPNNLS